MEKEKFVTRHLTSVDAFNYEIELPIYDGLVICYVDAKTDKKTDLMTITYTPASNFTYKVPAEIKLGSYITSYEDFKIFDDLVEKSRYHLKLAHEISATFGSLLDD